MQQFTSGSTRRESRSSRAHDSITERSRMDYAVYAVSGTSDCVLALIMEAKMSRRQSAQGIPLTADEEKKILNKAVAQVCVFYPCSWV